MDMDMHKKEKPSRCDFTTCKKKLLLSDFACRCGNFYCLNHRLSEQHVCTYDYAGRHKNELLKTMSSAVVALKLERI